MRSLPVLAILCVLAACYGDGTLAPGDGQLRVSLTMAGLDLDTDGAEVSVDGGTPVAVILGRPATFALDAGRHTVLLSGLAANCAANGQVSREVRVREGETTDVAFGVTCGATDGVIEIVVSTQGADKDPNGYLVRVDGGSGQRVIDGFPVRFSAIQGGARLLTFWDLAANCTVVGGNPASVQMNTGGPTRDTLHVAVTVECVAARGDLKLITVTSGPPDPDGYTLTLDPSPGQSFRMLPNDTTLVPNLMMGAYTLGISDVVGTCIVTPAPPVGVTVVGGQTTVLQLTVQCFPPAVLRVSTATTGASLDPGYLVQVDGGPAHRLLAGTVLSLDLTPGAHSVALSDIAPNCTVGGSNPVSVNLSTTAATDLVFPVTCTAVANTGLDVTIATTGTSPDDSYVFYLCIDYYCYQSAFSSVVPANSRLQVDLPPGNYFAYLADVSTNCQLRWPGTWTVTLGQVSAVRIDVTCATRADFVASVTTTGADQQQFFSLSVDGQNVGGFEPGSPLTVTSTEGVHAIGIDPLSLQPNCSVTSPNPVTITLVAGSLPQVDFTVNCVPLPILNISVSTTGSNFPANFLMGIDPDPLYGYAQTAWLAPNGSVTTFVYPGPHAVWLDMVPANCTVSGANPVQLNLAVNTTTDVAFTVTCR